MTSSDITKRELRAVMRKTQHTAHEYAAASQKACELALNMVQYKQAETLLVYMALPGEADPSTIAETALKQGKRVAYPRCAEGNTLELYLGDPAAFEKNKYGILEPLPGIVQRIEPREIDLIIVPGVAFDVKKSRLGHGAGYYDRLFCQLRPNAYKLGFAFSWQLVPSVPTEVHDVRMDAVVTDTGIV